MAGADDASPRLRVTAGTLAEAVSPAASGPAAARSARRSARAPSKVKSSAAAARADAVHGTGCSRQCLPSDVSEDQGGRNARARMRRDAPAAEPPAEGRRLGPYRGCAWEGVRMRRSAKAAQGWPAPKSEQKVTCAAPNGCSYTVFCPRTADGVPLDPGPLSTDERAHNTEPFVPEPTRRKSAPSVQGRPDTSRSDVT